MSYHKILEKKKIICLNKSHHLYDRVTLCAVIYQMPVVSTKREGGEMERKESKRKSLTQGQ